MEKSLYFLFAWWNNLFRNEIVRCLFSSKGNSNSRKVGGEDLAEIMAENSVFLGEVLWNPSRTVLGGNQSFQDATVCSELAACSVLFCRWWWRKVLCYIKDRCVLPCLQLGPKGKNSLSEKPNDLGKNLQPTTSSWDVREHFACCWQ